MKKCELHRQEDNLRKTWKLMIFFIISPVPQLKRPGMMQVAGQEAEPVVVHIRKLIKIIQIRITFSFKKIKNTIKKKKPHFSVCPLTAPKLPSMAALLCWLSGQGAARCCLQLDPAAKLLILFFVVKGRASRAA